MGWSQDYLRSLCCHSDWSTLDKCNRGFLQPPYYTSWSPSGTSTKSNRLRKSMRPVQHGRFPGRGSGGSTTSSLACGLGSLWELLKTITQDPDSPASLPPAVWHQTKTTASAQRSTPVMWQGRRWRSARRPVSSPHSHLFKVRWDCCRRDCCRLSTESIEGGRDGGQLIYI